MEPSAEVRKNMITQQRDRFQEMGYGFYLEAEALKVQDPGENKDEMETLITQFEAKMHNAYASAKKMQEMLDAHS